MSHPGRLLYSTTNSVNTKYNLGNQTGTPRRGKINEKNLINTNFGLTLSIIKDKE